MLKYLLIQLDDISDSFCHYKNPRCQKRLMPIETLKKAITFGYKENLIFEFLYPDYELPKEYKDLIDELYRADIVPSQCSDKELLKTADIVTVSKDTDFETLAPRKEAAYIFRAELAELANWSDKIIEVIPKIDRFTIVPTDVEVFSDSKIESYTDFLNKIADAVGKELKKGHEVQSNILTDRLLLNSMNNCNAGVESITIAPDGQFYICPAFYLDNESEPAGNLENGLNIKNRHLFELEYAPICTKCDAFHCKRCVWLNQRLTLEVNTPSHEQCIMAHTERAASLNLLNSLRATHHKFFPAAEINEIDYTDPFDKI